MVALRRKHVVRFLLAIPIVWLLAVLVVAIQQRASTTYEDRHAEHGHAALMMPKPDPNEALANALPLPIRRNDIDDEAAARDRDRDRDAEEEESAGRTGPRQIDIDGEAREQFRHVPVANQPPRNNQPPPLKPNNDSPKVAQQGGKEMFAAGEDTPPPAPSVAPDAPGEFGRAVEIDKNKLDPDERRKFDDGYKKNAYNQYASDLMSLHRSLPDVRDEECQLPKYPIEDLPDTSVIVCFHNEAWSALLRTVHSIIDRSPPRLLNEVILVDDFSDMDHLKRPLEDYLKQVPKVKIVRTPQREGLIRARLLGAEAAKGAVLTFLDSHCECTKGWLEPLLYRIHQNWTNVVTPVIDVIDDDNLRYHFGSAKHTSIGGFDWNLQFNWHPIPERERKRRTSDVDPVQTPTMAGGLFSIHRDYFDRLGKYDKGMDIWGGENLELSFKIWMCGGSLEIVPCSHVGHIFRKRSPYAWKTGENVLKKNSIRLAEVWMDGYRFYYYERFNYDLGNFGDVSERKGIRDQLKCNSFDWYLKNIYPEQFIPGEAMASGEIRNKAKAMCLDSPVEHADNKPVKMWPCHNQGGNQYWMLSKDGEIRRDEGCFDYSGSTLNIYPCHGMKGNQHFEYVSNNLIRHVTHNVCIELSDDGQQISMRPCDPSNLHQQWTWRRRSPDDPPLHLRTDLPPK